MAQCTTSIQWLNKSVMAPPPKFQYQRQWLIFFLAEGLIGSGAEPQLPIERLGVDGFGRPVPMIVLPPIGSHLRDASQAAGLDQVHGVAKVGPTALLHAALQNLLAGTHRAGERGAFLDGVGDRLFQINVFAGGQGIDRHANVPVVGRRDEHGIDVGCEHLAIIQMGGRHSVRPFPDRIAVRPVHIAHRHDLVRAELVGGVQQVPHPAAGSNHSDANGIVCTQHSGRGERGKSTCDDEAAAIQHSSPVRFYVEVQREESLPKNTWGLAALGCPGEHSSPRGSCSQGLRRITPLRSYAPPDSRGRLSPRVCRE